MSKHCIMDLSEIPRTPDGRFSWKQAENKKIKYKYNQYEGFITIIKYNNSKDITVDWNNKNFKTNSCTLLDGKIGSIINVITSEFRYNIGDIVHCKNQNVKITNRYKIKKNSKYEKLYDYECQKCGYIKNRVTEGSLRNKNGCPCCAGTIIIEGKNDIPTTAPWMVDYFQGGYDEAKLYARQSHNKIIPVCPICNSIQHRKRAISDIYKNHGCGCKCENKMSFPEMFMENLLDQFNIEYYREASNNVLHWSNNKRYDFYLKDYNCIIEVHGAQHYKKSEWNNQDLLTIQENDDYKYTLAKENGITNYFQVDCINSSIDYMLNSCIKINLLSFLNIDVDKIDYEKLYKNKLKDKIALCKKIVSDDNEISFAELQRKLGYKHSYDTQRIIDLCGYNIKSHNIPIDIYKNGNLFKTFSSKSKIIHSDKSLPYRVSSIQKLNSLIENKTVYNGEYIFSLHPHDVFNYSDHLLLTAK